MPSLKYLRAVIDGDNASDMRVAAHCRLALDDIEHGLEMLARHGYPFHLEPGHDSSGAFPRTMYHVTMPPRLVRCQADVEDLGAGWYDTPQEAARAAGMQMQFAGRGGIGKTNLPSVIAISTESQPHGLERSEIEDLRASFRSSAAARDSDAGFG